MKRSVLFLNQVAGPLFRELAEDVAVAHGGAELLTGHVGAFGRALCPELRVIPGPDYDRRSLLRRGWSWLRFFARALRVVWGADRNRILFIVSNPPFLPLSGWLAARLRRQQYCLLIYDLYPGVLVRLGRISPDGIVATVWRFFNRMTWSRASVVFTIGENMAVNVRAELAGLRNPPPVVVIPNWADVAFVRPIAKETNPFAIEQGQTGRVTVLYSGNLGDSHDVGSLVEAAALLKGDPRVTFLVIGSGARWNDIESAIRTRGLSNIRLLPFQPEARLPQTLTTGDIAVVSMERGTEGHMVPSKTFYYMAAGSAILAVVPEQTEVAAIAETDGCGLWVEPGNTAAIAAGIRRFLDDPRFLAECRQRSRRLAEERYSRANTALYVSALNEMCEGMAK